MTDPLAAVGSVPAPLTYAFTLGLVGAVNPCGFPLLPAYLALFAGGAADDPPLRRTMRGLAAGGLVTVGFVFVFGVLGLLVESGLRLVVGWVPWVMIVLAVAMTVLGLRSAFGRQVYLGTPRLKGTDSGRALGMVGFGVAYAVGSLSCALPVFLAGVAGSFTRLGLFLGASSFVAYALGMGLLLVVLSLVVAHAGAPALRRIRPLTRFVPRVAGVVLSLVGVYLMIYWVSALVAPSATPAPVQAVENFQSLVSGWLSHSSRAIGVVLGIVVVSVVILVAAAGRHAVAEGAVPGETAPRGDPMTAEQKEEPVGR